MSNDEGVPMATFHLVDCSITCPDVSVDVESGDTLALIRGYSYVVAVSRGGKWVGYSFGPRWPNGFFLTAEEYVGSWEESGEKVYRGSPE